MNAERDLCELVASSGRVLTASGQVDHLGHASARVPGTDRVVVKPKHSPTVRQDGADRPPAPQVITSDDIATLRGQVAGLEGAHLCRLAGLEEVAA